MEKERGAEARRRDVLVQLFDIEAVKFGNFTLKSGIESPVYFDLRVIISYPQLMSHVSELLWQASAQCQTTFQSICGVPYTALPLATCMSTAHNVGMVMRRKEAKDYGTKRLIEGRWKSGDVCLVVEDVVTTGSSVLETTEALRREGLTVHDAVVLLDRDQGGKAHLANSNISLHSVFSMSELLKTLLVCEKIDQSMFDRVQLFLNENKAVPLPTSIKQTSASTANSKLCTFEERAALCSHPVSKRLFNIMASKKTNLAFSADCTSCYQLLELARSVGPYICMLKTHVDILHDFKLEAMMELRRIADEHNFIIFEDRKFADIGNTVREQYSGGVYRISSWADVINAHILPGPGLLDGLRMVDASKACILIGQMSSAGNLLNQQYTDATVEMARNYEDFVIGFICTQSISQCPTHIHFTPGVRMEMELDTNGGQSVKGDGLGQQYLTPQVVIAQNGSDVIIVGRGILSAEDPAQAAKTYRDAGYFAYLNKLQAASAAK